MSSFVAILLCAVFGILVGMASGLLGIGGGGLISPFLRIVMGVPGLVATATSLMAIIPTAISGTLGHVRTRTINLRMGLLLGLAGCLCSPLGARAADACGGFVVLMGVAAVGIYTSYTMFRKYFALRRAHKAAVESGDTAGDKPFEPTAIEFKPKVVAGIIAAGMVTGFMSGFLGLGGGFIMIPIITGVFGLSMKEASGTSLMAIAILALPGVITQFTLGNVDLAYGLAVALGSIPGAFIGGLLAPKVPERHLRLLFGIVFVLIALSLVVNDIVLL